MLELERGLASLPAHALLRRLGSAAPLLGVVLSVLAMGIEVQRVVEALAQEQAAQIATRLVGLASGVCAGAVLALTNHGLLAILHSAEVRAFDRAVAGVDPGMFSDGEARIDRAVAQIDAAASALQSATLVVEGMLRTARDAMSGMSESCNEAATDLKAMSGTVRDAIGPPISDFVMASQKLKDATSDAAQDFMRSIKTLSKQAERIDDQIGRGLQRQQSAVTAQEAAATALVQSTQSLQQALSALDGDAITALASSITEATVAVKGTQSSLAKSMDEVSRNTVVFAEKIQEARLSIAEFVGKGAADLRQAYAESVRDLTQLRQTALQVDAALDALRLQAPAVGEALAAQRLSAEAAASLVQSVSTKATEGTAALASFSSAVQEATAAHRTSAEYAVSAAQTVSSKAVEGSAALSNLTAAVQAASSAMRDRSQGRAGEPTERTVPYGEGSGTVQGINSRMSDGSGR